MPPYKTPGVYVEEIATLPPSVADVATAIPAFLGYTERGNKDQPTRITSMVDYTAAFGGPCPTPFTVSLSSAGDLLVERSPADASKATSGIDFALYYSLKLYFDNGGGPCYVVSLGGYTTAPKKDDFGTGLDALATEDEPTLIVLTDAVGLGSDYFSVCQAVLKQCGKLRDRFAILDVVDGDTRGDAFRTGIGSNYLNYGAAYTPYLQTSLAPAYDETAVTVKAAQSFQVDKGIRVGYSGASAAPKVQIQEGTAGADADFDVTDGVLTIKNVPTAGVDATKVVAAWQAWKSKPESKPLGFDIAQVGDGSAKIAPVAAQALSIPTLAALKDSQTQVYNQVKTALGRQRVTLPPSPAMAGVYAAVDRDRGVWKAPANVSLASVIAPKSKVSSDDQDNLNVDPNAGKSINAIRSFAGKGTLVWGARTLAGNDNEWRYINVRRLFIMIEEATQKASSFAVFEGNDATTWLKVKGMIDSYLYGLWEQGALAGSTPEKAYYVNVGLGKTMTAQNILEGLLIVEIGIAAVRPAEFIIIRFSHKLQEA